MYTEQFRQALDAIYSNFRIHHIAHNPGCNANDIERAFLLKVMGLCPHKKEIRSKLLANIDEIR